MECLKIGLNHTEFCACQVRGPQIVQAFSYRVKPLTETFLVSDEHSHIEYNQVLSLKTVYVFGTFS